MSYLAVSVARQWLGTPFIAGASVCGVGCDCAGLIEGVAKAVGVACPARQSVDDDILIAACALMVPARDTVAGALLLLSPDPGGVPVHAALFTDADTIIHAHWSAGVVENRFGNWFARRVTHIFAWPEPSLIKEI